MYKTLFVIAKTSSPVITDGFLPLDSILFYYNNLYTLPSNPITLPSSYAQTIVESVRMPIAIINDGKEDWYYKCSFAFWSEPIAFDKTQMAKRFDAHAAERFIDFKGKRGRVDLDKGHLKNYFIEDFCLHSNEIAWLIECDEHWLKGVLNVSKGIGKKAAHGYGSVMRWDIHELSCTYDDISEQILMRSIPTANNEEILYGIRPSYWHQSNIFPVAMPSKPLTLTQIKTLIA